MIKSPLTSGLKPDESPDESPGPIPRIGSAKSWRARLSRAKEMGELHRGTSGLGVGGWINCSTFFFYILFLKGDQIRLEAILDRRVPGFFANKKHCDFRNHRRIWLWNHAATLQEYLGLGLTPASSQMIPNVELFTSQPRRLWHVHFRMGTAGVQGFWPRPLFSGYH